MNKLISKYILCHYKYISFDVFDTLIERKVNKPTDIFALVGKNILGEEKSEEFRELRKRAESSAREAKHYTEITLEEIYEELSKLYDKEVIKRLKNEETRLEIDLSYAKKEIIEFYNSCIKKDKQILIISDMYLPAKVIKKMLEHCNITNYDSLYVSNEYGVNKISGKLFKIVLNQKGIKQSEIVHIGDSVKADFLGARKVGIKSILIRRKNRLKRLIHS